MAVERIRALTLSDEIETAVKEMQSIGLDPGKLDANQPDKDWGLRHGTTNVAIARWLVRARRPKRPRKPLFGADNCYHWPSCE
jgi:hypothetical protein